MKRFEGQMPKTLNTGELAIRTVQSMVLRDANRAALGRSLELAKPVQERMVSRGLSVEEE